jgi:hypothetical protein
MTVATEHLYIVTDKKILSGEQLLEMATAFGVRVAWYRFGSHLRFHRLSGQRTQWAPSPVITAESRYDYQSGTKLHALQRLR